MMNIDINSTKEKHPKQYAFRTLFSGALASLVLLVIVVGYGMYLIWGKTDWIYSVGILILCYYVWWLIRGCEYIVSTISALFELKKYERFDFNKILAKQSTKNNPQESLFVQKLPQDIDAIDVIHWCMIPMYNEGPEILYETIKAIHDADYDLSRVAVTIHGEAARADMYEKALEACKPLTDIFGYFNSTLHTLQPDEMAGKGANITHGANELYQEILTHFHTTANNVLVTTLDADNIVDKTYFSILTYTYLTTPNRKYASYQPVIFFFNNFWQAPFFSQIVSLFNTFWILFNFTKKYGPKNFSSHAQPLDALIELDFWSKETIVEDGHQYWRSFFGFKGNYECVPVFAKIYQDCNLSTTTVDTVKAQYKQMRRWAHGAQDVPYVRCQMMDNWHSINRGRMLFEFFRMLEGFFLWSTLHVILLAGIAFTLLKDVQFSSYLSLGGSISFLTNIAFTITVVAILLSLLIFPYNKLKKRGEKIERVFMFLIFFFIFVGPSLFIFCGLPALHTQIGIMLGKPMKKFNVTTKVR